MQIIKYEDAWQSFLTQPMQRQWRKLFLLWDGDI
jgi:hypothetical protein